MRYLDRMMVGDRLWVRVPGTGKLSLLSVRKAVTKNESIIPYDPTGNSTLMHIPVVKGFIVQSVMANGQRRPHHFGYTPEKDFPIMAIWRGRERFESPRDLPHYSIMSTTDTTYQTIQGGTTSNLR